MVYWTKSSRISIGFVNWNSCCHTYWKGFNYELLRCISLMLAPQSCSLRMCPFQVTVNYQETAISKVSPNCHDDWMCWWTGKKKKWKKKENCYKKFKAWRREDEQEIRWCQSSISLNILVSQMVDVSNFTALDLHQSLGSHCYRSWVLPNPLHSI